MERTCKTRMIACVISVGGEGFYGEASGMTLKKDLNSERDQVFEGLRNVWNELAIERNYGSKIH